MKVHSTFQDIQIVAVWGDENEELLPKVKAMWLKNKVLPQGTSSDERSKQVVVAAVDSAGNVIGVNTVYTGDLHRQLRQGNTKPERVSCYFYRQYIQPESRVPQLMRVMLNACYDVLAKARQSADPECLVIVAENPGVARQGVRNLLERNGYKFWRRNAKGQSMFRRDFQAS